MRALIVDDSAPARLHAGKMLAELGFEVYEAAHGGDALGVLAQLGPLEVVVLDWNMPYMDGLELLKTLRRDRKFDPTLVVMATGNSDLDSVTRALEAGANEYVMKPFTRDDLAGKLAILGFAFSEPEV
ncbi:MAG TPA: response regulator [Anaeromyxobacteraceae bacterium]|nr:response regulator [Anaeromyxobacteraceae bacterium]